MDKLRIIPLGGLGEVGKNMMAFEYGRNIMIVDVGMMFPEHDMPGVDYIIPDYRYLRGKEERIRGVVITHGHEDHIGALPYFLEDFPAPVYATKLTRGLIEVKLRTDLKKRIKLQTIQTGDVIRLGPFTVEPYHVCHSIPDAIGLGIETPVGLVVHSGDYKLDHTPVDGWPTEIRKLAEFSQRGVLVLLSDSTNADHPGTTASELSLTSALMNVFQTSPGRIIVGTFASLISRIQQVFEVAERTGRKVAVAGTTMIKNIKMAQKLGYLDIQDGMMLSLQDVNRLPPQEVVIIATGAQGEPRSILGRLATSRHTSIRITSGDTVILSSHTIPGNEETVNRVINRLFQRGANVVYHPVAPVHVSGHASQDEQKTLLSIIRPQFFVPIHGELRHLKLHASLAQEVGIPEENIAVVENGTVLTFTKNTMDVGERVPGGYIYVDGDWVGDAISPQVIKSREDLAVAGVCSVAFVYDMQHGELVGRPRIVGRAIASFEVFQELVPAAQDVVRSVLKETKAGTPTTDVEDGVKKALSNYFYKKAKNRPEIIVTSIPAG